MIKNLCKLRLRLTVVDAQRKLGPVSVIFLIAKRLQLDNITKTIELTNPMAIVTIEGVKSVWDISEMMPPKEPMRLSYFRGLIRK